MNEFKLEGEEFIRLCDLLKKTGLCESGGLAKQVIAEGQVLVNNQVELRKRCKITVGQIVSFDNEVIKVIS